MENIFRQALLYDFYGELLTKHQRAIYEDAVYNDMSLSELALEYGISRQGVHDLIKRCDKILQGYEDKLHLVQKFEEAKNKVSQVLELSEELRQSDLNTEDQERLTKIVEISKTLMDEL